MLKGIYAMKADSFAGVYPPEIRHEIEQFVDIYAESQTTESIQQNPDVLRDAEIIFSGWGCPRLDRELLVHAPNLKAVFYAAGTMKGIITDACWDRQIVFSSAYAANAVPVAEFTLAQILLSLKRGWQFALDMKTSRTYSRVESSEIIGNFKSTVGIISLGMVGRRVCQLLQNFDLRVIAYDPFVSQADAAKLQVELHSLEDVFRQSNVVSLHAPWLKETENLITGTHFAQMKADATFINTSRGAIVNEPEMIQTLSERPDIFAILDVTYPEPPSAESSLYSLPNVILTPHIAGSLGNERARMGEYMLQEFKRYISGEPLYWPVHQGNFAVLA